MKNFSTKMSALQKFRTLLVSFFLWKMCFWTKIGLRKGGKCACAHSSATIITCDELREFGTNSTFWESIKKWASLVISSGISSSKEKIIFPTFEGIFSIGGKYFSSLVYFLWTECWKIWKTFSWKLYFVKRTEPKTKSALQC